MSSVASNDAKERVRQAIDIVDLVGTYLNLRRQGRGYVGLCPWHDDSRPSLQVNPDRQSWKCWVCDVGGDVFSFVMQREGVGFREALELLADRAGISLQTAGARPAAAPGSPQDKPTLYRAMAWAEQQYHQCFLTDPEAETARKYIAERGIDDQNIRRFHIGYAPSNWQWIVDRAKSTPFSPAILEAAGLLARSETSGRVYDRFRGRVLFPIRDDQRRPIALGGRVLPHIAAEQEARTGRTPAKYINSPETKLFSKSDQLYALDIARDSLTKSHNVTVVEGYTDVIMAHQFGLGDVVAVLGTALGTGHIRLLRRFADTITLVLDGDEAGQRRTNEILELFVAAQVDLRILTLPEGLDPCDFVVQRGPEAFRELTAEAPNALEHRIRTAMRGIDPLNDLHAANRALEEILATLAKAPRLQSSTTESTRLREQQIINRLSREFQVPESEIRARLKELRQASKSRYNEVLPDESASKMAIHDLTAQERELLEILTQRPELAPQACEQIGRERLSSELGRTVFAIYQKLCRSGEPAEFTRVLTEVEDARLKHILVELDDLATEKSKHASEDAATRLSGLIHHFAVQQQAQQVRQLVAHAQQQNPNLKEQASLLKQLKDSRVQQRNRQGNTDPKEG